MKTLRNSILVLAILAVAGTVYASRTFDGNSDWFAKAGLSRVLNFPFSMSVWVKSTSDSTSQTAVFYGRTDAYDRMYLIGLSGTYTPDSPFIYARKQATSSSDVTSTGYSTGTWYNVIGVFLADNTRKVYVNGGSVGTDANAVVIGEAGTSWSLALGRANDSSPSGYFTGTIAEVGVWSIALGDDDILDLQTNYPHDVNHANLYGCWKLNEALATDNAVDLQGTNDLVANGDPGVSTDYPPIGLPQKAVTPTPANAAASQLVDVSLSWVDGGGSTTYTVYFDTVADPDSIAAKSVGQPGLIYDPLGDLAYATTYYWQINSINAIGTTVGDIWTFTTRAAPSTARGILVPRP
jgi:hypothetical protein